MLTQVRFSNEPGLNFYLEVMKLATFFCFFSTKKKYIFENKHNFPPSFSRSVKKHSVSRSVASFIKTNKRPQLWLVNFCSISMASSTAGLCTDIRTKENRADRWWRWKMAWLNHVRRLGLVCCGEGHISRWGLRGSGSCHQATPLCMTLSIACVTCVLMLKMPRRTNLALP